MNLARIHESSPFSFQGAGWHRVEKPECNIINWLVFLAALTWQMPWQLMRKPALGLALGR